jgi:hypothetical protein
MSRQIRNLSPSRYLTDDETVEISMHGECCTFRMRIWRGKYGPAIVVVSQMPAGPSPSWAGSRLANLAYQVYLGFSTEHTLNFEDEFVRGERRLFLVEFTSPGHGLRRCLTRAIRRPFQWALLEELLGSHVAR